MPLHIKLYLSACTKQSQSVHLGDVEDVSEVYPWELVSVIIVHVLVTRVEAQRLEPTGRDSDIAALGGCVDREGDGGLEGLDLSSGSRRRRGSGTGSRTVRPNCRVRIPAGGRGGYDTKQKQILIAVWVISFVNFSL